MAVVSRLAPPQRTYSDEQLVAAARRASDPAFTELYSRYAAQVRRFVAGRVGDIGRAEDLTQEIFVAALRRLRATETPIAFKPWLFEIARNACIDEFRRAQRRPEVALDGDALEDAAGPGASPIASPEAALDTRQRLSDLRGAFHALSPEHHRLIVLRELEGCSYEEIAVRLGMSPAMVESGLFRARRKLGREYDELASGRRCEVVQSAIAAGDESTLRGLGLRRRRQISRHLSHCDPCRRAARGVGLAEEWFRAPTPAEKLASLLPLPWLPWPSRRSGRSSAGDQLASVASPLGPLADPSGPLHGLSRAAAAVIAVLIAGAGGSAFTGHHTPRANTVRPAAAAPGSQSARALRSEALTTPSPPAHDRTGSMARSSRPRGIPRHGAARQGARPHAAPDTGRSRPSASGANPTPVAGGRPSGSLPPAGIPAAGGVTAGGSALTGAAAATVGQLGQATAAATAGVLGQVSTAGGTVAAATGSIAATAGGAAAATAGSVVKRTVQALAPVAH